MKYATGVLLAVLVYFVPASLAAFEISSAASEACHERLTVLAAESAVLATPFADDVRLPDNDSWKLIVEHVLDDVAIDASTERERFILASFALGSRWPDTKGHALTSAANMRQAHSESENQYDHCLRTLNDDYEKGNISAIDGAKATISGYLNEAAASLEESPDEQLLTREFYADFYGRTDVVVWGPAFYLGNASHVLQDSFSHTLRSDDATQILHVFNFVEASSGDYQLERDGLRHSTAMDRCAAKVPQLAVAARNATIDLHEAFFAEQEGAVGAVDEQVFDRWMTFRDGCDERNDYCDAKWLEVAESAQSKPLLSCASTPTRRPFPLSLVIFCLAVAGERIRRKRA